MRRNRVKEYDFPDVLPVEEVFLPMNRLLACLAVLVLASHFLAAQIASPSSAAQPNVTTTATPEVQQFQKIEDQWSNAVTQRDQYALENVLSALFVDVAANGDITTRNQQIVAVISGDDKSLALTQKVITVRMLGDIAVANGTYTMRHKVNSAIVDEKGIFTHVYERAHGGWVCINSQRTALKEDAAGKQKKSSPAIEPFHFPLFGGKN